MHINLLYLNDDSILSSVNSRVKNVTHKYGVQIPSSVEQAYRLDKESGNTLWRDALNRKMNIPKVAFDILDKGSSPPPGYSKSSGHIIFDVRMTLDRKTCWVKDGHKTQNPGNCTYAGVVSRESVCVFE